MPFYTLPVQLLPFTGCFLELKYRKKYVRNLIYSAVNIIRYTNGVVTNDPRLRILYLLVVKEKINRSNPSAYSVPN